MRRRDEIPRALRSHGAGRAESLATDVFKLLPWLVLALAATAAPTGTLRAETDAGKLRIVDLYRGADGKPGAVDVYLGKETPGASPTVTLPFAQSSAYLTVPSPPPHLVFYRARERASSLYDLNLKQEVGPGTPVSVNGEQVTVNGPDAGMSICSLCPFPIPRIREPLVGRPASSSTTRQARSESI